MLSRSPSLTTEFGRRLQRPVDGPAPFERIDLTGARSAYEAHAGEMAVVYAEPGEMDRRERAEITENERSGSIFLFCAIVAGMIAGAGLTACILALLGKL